MMMWKIGVLSSASSPFLVLYLVSENMAILINYARNKLGFDIANRGLAVIVRVRAQYMCIVTILLLQFPDLSLK